MKSKSRFNLEDYERCVQSFEQSTFQLNNQKNFSFQDQNQQFFSIEQIVTKKKKVSSPNFALKVATQENNKKSGNFWWIFSLIIFFTGAFSMFGFFFLKVNSTFGKISDKPVSNEAVINAIVDTIKNEDNSSEKLDGFKEGRINILLLGMAGENKPGQYLTDTIMIASVDTENFKVSLLSLPRDFLIKQNGNYYVKINSLYQSGLRKEEGAKVIIENIEKITQQKIHYYLTLDFEGFIKMIDTLDGVNVDVPRDIKDTRYPGPNYSYETFEIKKGLQSLDGETALKYARTRHDDVESDFGRAKRQQQILQAVRNKAFSLEIFLNPLKINEMLENLGEHVHTNISVEEIGALVDLAKKIDSQNVSTVVVDAWKDDSLLKSARFYSETQAISGLVTRTGNYSEIQDLAENIFDINLLKERKVEIEKEDAEILLVNATENSLLTTRVKIFLKELGMKNVETISVKNFEQKKTMVIDFTESGYPFSLDEIIKKIPAEKVEEIDEDLEEKIEKNEKSIIIILGDDVVGNYTYDEIEKDELENN